MAAPSRRSTGTTVFAGSWFGEFFLHGYFLNFNLIILKVNPDRQVFKTQC